MFTALYYKWFLGVRHLNKNSRKVFKKGFIKKVLMRRVPEPLIKQPGKKNRLEN